MSEREVESIRALGRKFFMEQDRLLGGPAPELCAPGYTARIGSNPPMDHAGHAQFARAFFAAFPDIRHEVEHVLVEGDTAFVRFVLRGTHTGSFFGIPATGKAVTVGAHVFMRTRAGQLTELLGVFDEAGMLRQLGVLPS